MRKRQNSFSKKEEGKDKIVKLPKRRDCEGQSKFTQVAHIKKITFDLVRI